MQNKDFWLVKHGFAMADIVCSDEHIVAAMDLQEYIRKMTGATLPILHDKEDGKHSYTIYLGGPPDVDNPDSYSIVVQAPLMWMKGNVQHAVYGLLEDYFGIRWYIPGPMGECIPSKRNLTLPNSNNERHPDFKFAYGFFWGGGEGSSEWVRRNRGHIGNTEYIFGHAWAAYIPGTKRNRADHPLWFARRDDGNGGHQLCTTNPEVIREMARLAVEQFRKEPESDLFSLCPNDNGWFCDCQNCHNLDKALSAEDGDMTPRLLTFYNEVAAEIKAMAPEFSDRKLGYLAYSTYQEAPKSIIPDSMVYPMVCHEPWQTCNKHSLDDENCETNNAWLANLIRWRDLCGGRVAVYDYFGHFALYIPWPIHDHIIRNIKVYHDLGVEGLMIEAQQLFATQPMNLWVGQKAIWDVTLNREAWKKEFLERFYGPAAGPMRDYWSAWGRLIEEADCFPMSWLGAVSPSLVEECKHDLQRASLAVAQSLCESSQIRRYSERVQLAWEGLKFTETWAKMQGAIMEGRFADAVRYGKEALSVVRLSADSVPQPFPMWLVDERTKSSIKRTRGWVRQRPK